jgi:hypothetical protein
VQFAVQPSGQVAVQLASQLQGVQLRLLLVPAGRQIRKLSPFSLLVISTVPAIFFDTLMKIGEACSREPSALLAVSAPWQCARSALSCRTFPQLALCHDITNHAFLSRRLFRKLSIARVLGLKLH